VIIESETVNNMTLWHLLSRWSYQEYY